MNDIVLLDGGMGQELIKRSGKAPTPLWSARVMLESPELVEAVHLDDIAAGAKLITVNAYAVTRCRLAEHDDEGRFESLLQAALDIAQRARDKSGRDEVRIAGCLSPLKWSYHPQSAPEVEEAAERFSESARLQAPHVDVMLCETMSSLKEARGAGVGAQGCGKPVWMAFSVDDGDGTRLRSGETLQEGLDGLKDLDLAAVLANCSRPEAVGQSVPILAETGLPFGAYANGFTGIVEKFKPGETVARLSARTDLDPHAYAEHAMAWAKRGARIVGGCCEVGPAHIAQLAVELRGAGYNAVGDLS